MRLIADMGDYYASTDNIISVPDDMDVQSIIDQWNVWYSRVYVPSCGTSERVPYKSWLDWIEERGGVRPKIEEFY